MMQLLTGLLSISLAGAAWMDSPRYGQGYVGGFQVPDGTMRPRCGPCDQPRSDPSRASPNSLDYRGNGADNLGYDWSPKAWGGPAFPAKTGDRPRMPDQDWGSRGGRRMPGQWDEGCRECAGGRPPAGRDRDRYTERPGFGGRDPQDPGWGASTEHSKGWTGSESPRDAVSTVTSSVLGVRLRDDKRLPVEWPGEGRNMRWDGFRNGMPWDKPDNMDRMDSFRPWDGTGQGVSGWDRDGKGHYASDWSYGSRSPAGSGAKWNEDRPWTQSWDRKNQPSDRGYGQGGSNPQFGSSYPHSDRFPSSSNQPSYSTNTWRPTTGSYSPKPSYNYETTSRPQSQYPLEIITPRPGYPSPSRPSYPSDPHQNPPSRPQGGSSWNYPTDRPGQWTTARPDQNYLPQSSRPPSRPTYEFGGSNKPNRPYEGSPGTAIWNGRPGSYDTRPGSSGGKPQGFYQGFITEIQDPNYAGGNRYPSDRPSASGGYNQDRFPSNGHPASDQFPNRYDKNPPINSRPGYDDNRFPTNADRYPSPRPSGNDRPYEGNRAPGYDTDRNRYPGQGSYDTDRNRYPNYNADRNKYPNSDSNRNPYPTHNTDRNQNGNDRYPSYNSDRDRDKYPSYNSDRDRDRIPSYSNDRDRDRIPSYGSDRDRDRDRIPSYGSDRDPGHSSDRDRDRYPSRPSSSDHDRGPSPASDTGSWNYGEDEHKDGTYRRAGGSYPPFKGGQYYTSSYLASASTPAASSQELDNKNKTDETTIASSQER